MNEQQVPYWRANLKLIFWLLSIWFTVPFLAGIVFVDFFNQLHLGGYKLGFWIAQQGSIYLFVVLIFVYAWKMNKLDQQFAPEPEDD